MTRRCIAFLIGLALASLAMPVPTHAAAQLSKHSEGFTVPIQADSADQGSFNGTLRVTHFAVVGDTLVAVAVVSGTLVDENGVMSSHVRVVSLPVHTGAPTAAAAAVIQQVECGILHLELGPLDLDLLGLVVHLDRVVLDITAVPGAGNLLGNLLCAIVNLLNSGGLLSQIADLLNQLLDLLG
jgi:hypothetical protein